MASETLTISVELNGQRLDKALVVLLAPRSRVTLQREIKAGRIAVNQKHVSPHLVVKTGDIISVTPKPTEECSGPMPEFKLLQETPDYLVIEKPSGVIVHPAPGVRGLTLADALLKSHPELAQVGDDPTMRPGIVHRLDKDVSGVMVVARNPATFAFLKSQFQNRAVHKRYIGLVHGIVTRAEGSIDFPIARSSRQGRMVARPSGDEHSREAHTDYEVIRRFGNATLLSLMPRTGRTHQLRVHLKALGHPLVGDPLYGRKIPSAFADVHRIFLHAAELTLSLPNGERRTWISPLPKECEEILSQLTPLLSP